MAENRTWYAILNVEESATFEEIKMHYREMAFKFHPDRNQGSFESTRLMQDINIAFGILKDNQKRDYYDKYLHALRLSQTALNRTADLSKDNKHKPPPAQAQMDESDVQRMENVLKKWANEIISQSAELAKHANLEIKQSASAGFRAGIESLFALVAISLVVGLAFKSCGL